MLWRIQWKIPLDNVVRQSPLFESSEDDGNEVVSELNYEYPDIKHWLQPERSPITHIDDAEEVVRRAPDHS